MMVVVDIDTCEALGITEDGKTAPAEYESPEPGTPTGNQSCDRTPIAGTYSTTRASSSLSGVSRSSRARQHADKARELARLVLRLVARRELERALERRERERGEESDQAVQAALQRESELSQLLLAAGSQLAEAVASNAEKEKQRAEEQQRWEAEFAAVKEEARAQVAEAQLPRRGEKCSENAQRAVKHVPRIQSKC